MNSSAGVLWTKVLLTASAAWAGQAVSVWIPDIILKGPVSLSLGAEASWPRTQGLDMKLSQPGGVGSRGSLGRYLK